MGIGTKSGIMAAAGSSNTQQVFREFNLFQSNTVGINAGSGNWLTEVSESNSDQVAGPFFAPNNIQGFNVHAYPQSGRGSTLYSLRRGYMELHLTGSEGITGSITAANIYLPVSLSQDNGPGYIQGGALNIYAAGTGKLIDGQLADYSLYFDSSIGNKTAYADSQTISANTILTYSLNPTAITVLNDNNNFGGSGNEINFAVIWDFDFTGTAPTNAHAYNLTMTGSEVSNPGYLVNGFLPPRIELTYIPD